jgi:hypothetical protein
VLVSGHRTVSIGRRAVQRNTVLRELARLRRVLSRNLLVLVLADPSVLSVRSVVMSQLLNTLGDRQR